MEAWTSASVGLQTALLVERPFADTPQIASFWVGRLLDCSCLGEAGLQVLPFSLGYLLTPAITCQPHVPSANSRGEIKSNLSTVLSAYVTHRCEEYVSLCVT